MKRGVLLLLFVFVLSVVSATPTLNPQFEDLQPGETFLANISTVGEFTRQITTSDIKFYEGRKEVFFESDITFYNGTFHMYVYTTREGNFTMEISQILFKEGGELKEATIEHPLNISTKPNSEENKSWTEILSIKPGFIFGSPSPTLKLINKGNISLNITLLDKSISLEPLQTHEEIITPEDAFSTIRVSSYKEFDIPIIHPTYNGTFVPTEKKHDLKYNPELVLMNIILGREATASIELFNFGENNLTNLRISSDVSFLDVSELENIPPRGDHNLTLTFSPESPGHIKGNVFILYNQLGEDNNVSIPLSLFVLPEGSTEENFAESNETCEGKGGLVCADGEICNGAATFTKGPVYCCLAACVPDPKGPGNSEWGLGWVVGVIILLGLGGLGYYFYRRTKKTKQKKPDEKLKESSEKYNKRIKGVVQRS
jgi:hypothetical protein